MEKKLYAVAVVFALAMFLVGLLAHAAKRPKEFELKGFGYDCYRLVGQPCYNCTTSPPQEGWGNDEHWFELSLYLKGSNATGSVKRCDVDEGVPDLEDCKEFPIENGTLHDGLLSFTFFDLEDEDGPFLYQANLFVQTVDQDIALQGGIVQFSDEDENGVFHLDALIAVPELSPDD